MINLIDKDDFSIPYQVVAGSTALETRLDDIITQYQRAYLIDILGDEEYNKFENDFSGGVPQSQEWIDFLDGATYTKESVSGITLTINYLGIKPVLAKLIYKDYQHATITKVFTNGKAQVNRADATQMFPDSLIVEAYNLAIDEIWNGSEYAPTVYNFLEENETDYPDWVFKKINKINRIGI
jgi:hypothetical protein